MICFLSVTCIFILPQYWCTNVYLLFSVKASVFISIWLALLIRDSFFSSRHFLLYFLSHSATRIHNSTDQGMKLLYVLFIQIQRPITICFILIHSRIWYCMTHGGTLNKKMKGRTKNNIRLYWETFRCVAASGSSAYSYIFLLFPSSSCSHFFSVNPERVYRTDAHQNSFTAPLATPSQKR